MISYVPAFLAAVVIAVLHQYGAMSGLYTSTYYFDVLMHGLAGFFIGYSAIWLGFRLNIVGTRERGFSRANLAKIGLIAIIAIAAIGVGWEIFEYIHMLTDHSAGETYWSDTSVDLIMDLLGTVVAWIWARWVTCCRGCNWDGGSGACRTHGKSCKYAK